MCANPADPMPTGSAAIIRLRDRVVSASAERGFFVSVRGFTGQGAALRRNRAGSIDRQRRPHPRDAPQPQGNVIAAGLQGHVPPVRRYRATQARQ